MLKECLVDYVICGIVFTRGANGATISEIRSDFSQITLQKCNRLNRETGKIVKYLNRLPGLVMDVLPSGAYVWYAQSFCSIDKDDQIAKNDRKSSGDEGIGTGSSGTDVNARPQTEMKNPSPKMPNENIPPVGIANNDLPVVSNSLHDVPTVMQPADRRNRDESIPTIEITDDHINESTFNAVPIPIQGLSIHCDVNVDRLKAYSENKCAEMETDGISYIGDDFLLSFITQEYKFQNRMDAYPAQCGHCISGQTIAKALDEIEKHPETFRASTYLVNLGAMDILIGRDIYDIEADYKRLIVKLLELKKLPICTTLPPIFITHEEHGIWPQVYQKLLLFNRFVEDLMNGTHIPFIDFWSFLTSENCKPVKPYYQPRMTVVTADSYVIKFALWNKLGRETLKKNLRTYLET